MIKAREKEESGVVQEEERGESLIPRLAPLLDHKDSKWNREELKVCLVMEAIALAERLLVL